MMINYSATDVDRDLATRAHQGTSQAGKRLKVGDIVYPSFSSDAPRRQYQVIRVFQNGRAIIAPVRANS